MKEMIQTLGRTKKMNWCHSIIEVACMQRITKKIYHLDSALTILMVWYPFLLAPEDFVTHKKTFEQPLAHAISHNPYGTYSAEI
jgi:hypothetical protein